MRMVIKELLPFFFTVYKCKFSRYTNFIFTVVDDRSRLMFKILIVIGALFLIGFIIWWFLIPRPQKAVTARTDVNHLQNVTVKVDGGYRPSTVVVYQGKPAQITFNRIDPSSCLEQVVFPDWGISEYLPEKKEHPIKIDTSKAGEYQYACGMNMFHGKVIVKKERK